MQATYVVEIDIERDGTYDHVLSDVTARIMGLQWNNGLWESYSQVAPPAQGRVQLDNSDGAFNPEDTGATYYGLLSRDMLVRIRTTAPETETLFIGKIAALRVTPGRFGPRTVDIDLRDLLLELQDAEYSPPLQQDVTTDAVIRAIFDKATVAVPYATDYWVLGISGSSELGSTTILADATDMVDLETGDTTLDYAGDVSGSDSGTSAMKVIKDAVAAEAGGSSKFFYNTRTGLFTFHRRLKNANPSIAATFDESDLLSVDYRYADDIVNSVEVTYSPREVGTAGVVLWSNDSEPINLAPGESKKITGRYFNPDNDDAKVAGIDIIQPSAGVDYIANTLYGNGGTYITQNLVVEYDISATDVKFNLRNTGGQNMWVTRLQIRGTPIISYKKATVTAESVNSIALYNKIAKSISMVMVSDGEIAQNYADATVAQFAMPAARLASVTIRANDSSALMTQALTRTVGDVITITLADENHDKDYEIVGERHTVTPGGEHRHEVVWTLRPVSRLTYWILGVAGKSELGTTTNLAF